MASAQEYSAPRPAVLIVVNPSGNRSRVPLEPLPFVVGRQAGGQLMLRDNRISRAHARIVAVNGNYIVEDLESRHGTFVNGERVQKHTLKPGDRIEFGFGDSFKLTFTHEEEELSRILDQIHAPTKAVQAGAGNLGKLRALVEVARALQSSLSSQEVLTAVVDAALSITGSERGFLLLQRNGDLDVSVARDNRGAPLATTDLKVPMSVINRSLRNRRELLSMQFDPAEAQGVRPENSVADLDLRSVVCVPLVRVRSSYEQNTTISTTQDTVGVLYMDSRLHHADLSHGNRELLQTLALEASTILENARLLEQERAKQRLEEELDIARQIQTSLLPSQLPTTGWFRAAGSSSPSHQVGGDYFEVRQISFGTWVTVVADVSGKGVSSALLASLLQGAFLLASESPAVIEELMSRVNHYLNEKTQGEKYATVFYSTLNQKGLLQWSNAGHCSPILVRATGQLKKLQTTGMPLGMMEFANYGVENVQLERGDKLVIYSDGITEAENAEGEFFGAERLRTILRENLTTTAADLHKLILSQVEQFTEGAVVNDDVTLVVLEYQ